MNPLAQFPYTDVGNAERLQFIYGERLRYVKGLGYLVWDGKRWRRDDANEVIEMAKSTARKTLEAAAGDTDQATRKAAAEWAVSSESNARINAMVTLAKSDPKIAVPAEKLDADPWLFNCDNGTIDLKTGKLRPHDPADLITKISPVEFGDTEKCPMFVQFMERIFAGDAELVGYVLRLFGYCLTGDIREQIMPICWGAGANGKSTLLDTIQFIMGDYAASAADSLLVTNGRQEHPCELADLQGRRLVVASETENGMKLRLQLVKKLTGDAFIRARLMYGDPFTFQRTHKLMLVTNNKPVVREDSEAVWRRLRLIPFAVTIPGPERDPLLAEKLRKESPGILAWLVQGCISWNAHGLGAAAAVARATQGYREDSDPLKDFIDDACILGPDLWTPTAQIRHGYERYCEENGTHPIGGKVFAERLVKLGCAARQRYAGRGWIGIGLVSSEAETTSDLLGETQ